MMTTSANPSKYTPPTPEQVRRVAKERLARVGIKDLVRVH